MMKRARILFAGVLCVAAAATVGTAGAKPPADVVADRAAALASAEARWDIAAIDDYRYRIEQICFCLPTRPVTTVVTGGVPKPTRPPYRRVNTVEKLFDFIRANLDNDNLTVKYSALGVPREIGSDPDFRIADEELYYTIDRFKRLNP